MIRRLVGEGKKTDQQQYEYLIRGELMNDKQQNQQNDADDKGDIIGQDTMNKIIAKVYITVQDCLLVDLGHKYINDNAVPEWQKWKRSITTSRQKL